MSTHAVLPCKSCGDGVAVRTDYLTPVTLCGACTPADWDGATLPIHAGVWTDADPALDLADLLDHPCMPTRESERVCGLIAGDYAVLTPHALVMVRGAGNIEALLEADERRAIAERDHAASYDALSDHLGTLEMTSDAAVELRARVRKDAA